MKKVILSMAVLSVMMLTGCGGSGSSVSATDATTDATVVAQNISAPNTGALALPAVPTLPVDN